MAGDTNPANDIHRANLGPLQRDIDRFGPIARANFVAIQDEIDNPMTFGPSKEHTMTSPTQRRHDEILGRLDALIDAVKSTSARDNLHRLLAEESAAERRDEPVDVTEEPPVGSQVTDNDGDVWERFDEAGNHGWTAWDDRHRCWGLASAVDCLWFEVGKYAPLRLTTDADRERVGLPVDTAPDVDSDEALAEVVRDEWWASVEAGPERRWRNIAHAAREHINGGMDICIVIDQREEQRDRAERAEADVERLTRERDEAEARCERLSVLAEKGERYEALREDVTAHALHHAHDQSSLAFDCFATTLEDDDKRGRDA